VRIAVAADHAGFPLKQPIIDELRRLEHDVIDLGTHGAAPVDYPDIAESLGEAVRRGDADRGIVICGSGVGASIAANELPGVRAGVAHDTYSAHQGVEHDDMNVLAVGARVVGEEVALELVRAFVSAEFSGDERHVRRLNKLLAIERRSMGAPTPPGS
jgi:ribose 5-phosphate isomerase B